jgi:hypothetical protein
MISEMRFPREICLGNRQEDVHCINELYRHQSLLYQERHPSSQPLLSCTSFRAQPCWLPAFLQAQSTLLPLKHLLGTMLELEVHSPSCSYLFLQILIYRHRWRWIHSRDSLQPEPEGTCICSCRYWWLL